MYRLLYGSLLCLVAQVGETPVTDTVHGHQRMVCDGAHHGSDVGSRAIFNQLAQTAKKSIKRLRPGTKGLAAQARNNAASKRLKTLQKGSSRSSEGLERLTPVGSTLLQKRATTRWAPSRALFRRLIAPQEDSIRA